MTKEINMGRFMEYLKKELIKEEKKIELECEKCNWKKTVHRSLDIPNNCPLCHNQYIKRLYKEKI
jgi:Zn finger protein HypA/HybF involved in hydrogenase expression